MAQATSNLLYTTPATQAMNNAINPQPLAQSTALKTTAPPSNGSIVDYLNSQGKASDYNTRSQLASQYGISGYQGTADQNTQLLGILQSGKLPTTQNTPVQTPPTVNPNFSGVTQPTQQTSVPAITPPDTQAPIAPIATPPAPVTYPGLINTLANQGNSQNNQIITQSAGALQNLGGNNPATSGPAFDAYTKAIQEQNDLKQGIAKQYSNVEQTPIPLEFQQGREQVLGRQYASQLDAAQQAVNQQQAALGYQISGQQAQQGAFSAAGGLAQGGQSLNQGALGTAIGASSPSFQGYGAGQYVSPTTGQPVNGSSNQYGTGPEASSNVATIKGNTDRINSIQGQAPAVDAAFSVLNSYAQQVGGGNVPILQGIQQAYGSTAQGSQAVAGFKAQLQAVRAAWTAIEGGNGDVAIPDNVTASQLTQIQKQLKADAQNKVTALQTQNNQLSNQGNSSSSGSSSSSIYNF